MAANNLAFLYADEGGNLDLALQLAQTAKQHLPNSAEVDDTLGWVYYKKGCLVLRCRHSSEPHKPPRNGQTTITISAWHMRRMDQKAQAKAAFHAALKINPALPGAARGIAGPERTSR